MLIVLQEVVAETARTPEEQALEYRYLASLLGGGVEPAPGTAPQSTR